MSTPTNARRKKTAQEKKLQAKLSSFISEARQISENIDPIVSKYELQSSEFLIGICGGVLSSLVTYLILIKYALFLTAAGISTACGLMLLFGIALAIFLFRGPSRWRADNSKGRMRALDEQMQNDLRAIRQEIKALEEAKAPAYVLDNAWAQYNEAANEFSRLRLRLIEAGTIKRVRVGQQNPALGSGHDIQQQSQHQFDTPAQD